MYLLEEINRIIEERNVERVGVFVDMDGVIADYRFCEVDNIINNVPGTYFKKRPINTSIKNLKKINRTINCTMYILSSCLFNEQADEKDRWLDKYAKFFKKENRIFTIDDTCMKRKKLKVTRIKEKLESKEIDLAILIDDTHDILYLAHKQLGEKVVPFHVIGLID